MTEKSTVEAIEVLAERMYWKFEQIAPGLEDFVPWGQLAESDRQMYRSVVRDLSRYIDLWSRLDDLASNGEVLG
jgi:hypothetical protein